MKYRSTFLFLLSLIFTLLITACSTVPTTEPDQAQRLVLYEIKSGKLQTVQKWALKGRLAINDGKDGGSGHLNWQKSDRFSRMSFHGALGRGAWQLTEDGSGATLEWADGELNRAETVAELVDQQLGWTIPVNALAWWVRGLAAPDDWEQRQLDNKGNLKTLSQNGWNIEYGRYRELGRLSMPLKLTARRQSYTVKIAIQNWDLGFETGKGE